MEKRLKILMKMFRISNQDLAMLLSVDVSLVSKWRSGTRSLHSNSEYMKKLNSYVIGLDRKNGYKKLQELLGKDYGEIGTMSEDEMSLLLSDWLNSTKEETGHYDIFEEMMKNKYMTRIEPLYYWEGREGRRQAVELFTEYAIRLSPGAEIISYTNETNQWFHEDKEFLHRWMKLIRSFFEMGNVMKIVHPMNRDLQDLAASMGKWLPLHMTCEVQGYYLKKYDEGDIVRITILILTNKMALFSVSTDKKNSDCRTWAVGESNLLTEIEKVAKKYLKDSLSLFIRYTLETKGKEKEFLNNMLSIYETGSKCYFYNDFNHMLPSSKEKRKKLLEHSMTDDNEIERVLTIFGTIDSLKRDCECYFIIDLEVLCEWLRKDMIKTNLLSLFAGEVVYVSNELYVSAVFEFLDRILIYDNCYICLAGEEEREELGHLSLCSGGKNVHTFITAYDTERTIALEVREYTVAVALYQKMEMIWNATPYLMKDKEYVVKYIKKQIREIFEI